MTAYDKETQAIETAMSWEMACDEFLADTERLGSWLQSVSAVRRPAVWFNTMMTVSELMAVMLDFKSTLEQCAEAAKEIKRRYIADCSEEIAERAHQLATRS